MSDKDSLRHEENESGSLGRVSFSELILGFASAALYYTGDSHIEGKASCEKNLQLAKHNIDIVKLLREKTRGNLSEDEISLVEGVIADLSKKYQASLAPDEDKA